MYRSNSNRVSLQSDSQNQAIRLGTSSKMNMIVNKLSKMLRFKTGIDVQNSGRRRGSGGVSAPRYRAERYVMRDVRTCMIKSSRAPVTFEYRCGHSRLSL